MSAKVQRSKRTAVHAIHQLQFLLAESQVELQIWGRDSEPVVQRSVRTEDNNADTA